jgi:hypothetical protein
MTFILSAIMTLTCLLSVLPASADDQMRFYGVITVSDSQSVSKLKTRFQATGSPVFLVGNARIGLTQGDILKFADKAVLINGDVWQTLKEDGILSKLTPVKIIVQRAPSESSCWQENSTLPGSTEQKKLFSLGSRLLQVFEKDFNGIPDSLGLFLQFNGNNVSIAAPKSLFKVLKNNPLINRSTAQKENEPADVEMPLIFINPPWDTLAQHKRNIWNLEQITSELAGKGIKLDSVSGTDSTFLSESRVICIPENSDSHTIILHFSRTRPEAIRFSMTFNIPVKPDLAPVFVSKLGGCRFVCGQEFRYAPAAIDPENGDVSVSASFTDNQHASWNGKELLLKTSAPGIYTAGFTATDKYGNSDSQRILWEVTDTTHWFRKLVFESKTTEGYNLLKLYYANRRVRAGVLTPCIGKIFKPEIKSLRHSPYIFVGCDILNRPETEIPEYMFLDFGITIRKPHPKLVTGGMFCSVSNRLNVTKPFRFVSEFEFTLSVNQLIVIADTSKIAPALESREEIAEYLDSLKQHSEEYEALARGVLGESVDEGNATALLRFEALAPVFRGFSAGPVFWSSIQPFKNRYDQFLGFSLRYSGTWRFAGMEQTIRAGTGGSNNPFSVWWDISTSIGTWDKK